MTLTKAQLFEIVSWPENGAPKVAEKAHVTVQFNPASLKVSYSNQVQTNGNNTGSSIQSVGKGDSKLAIELLFDVSGAGATDIRDVRQMTKDVAYFIEATPEKTPANAPVTPATTGAAGVTGAGAAGGTGTGAAGQPQQRYSIRGLRFQWGTFIFDGIVVSMDETLDLWSEEGHPLRATVSLSMSQPGIHFKFGENAQATRPPKTGNGNVPAGTTPLSPATQGATLQGMVANAGIKADWKAVAALNGIENPRNLAAGTLVNFKVGAKASLQAGGNLTR